MLSKYTLIVDQYTKIAIFSNIGKLNIIHIVRWQNRIAKRQHATFMFGNLQLPEVSPIGETTKGLCKVKKIPKIQK